MARNAREPVSVPSLLAVALVTALTAAGFARGWWWPNAHNGLLAIAFTVVGAYVLYQRPGHRAGRWFIATGVLHGVMFVGRQVGHSSDTVFARWAAWVGVWPIAISIAAVTMCVLVFPNGRFSSPRWRVVAGVVIAVASVCSTISALWPVEYEGAGVDAEPLFRLGGLLGADAVWSALAYPSYIGFQVMWVVALAWRWRVSNGAIRRQVAWLAAAAACSMSALVVGLLISGSPRAGVLSATLLPVAAGWSIVHGHFASVRRALTWIARTEQNVGDLAVGVCEAAAYAAGAARAELWIGDEGTLAVVGRWPDDGDYAEPRSLALLLASDQRHARAVVREERVVGALSVARGPKDPLTRSESALLDALAAQASLVIENLSLAKLVDRERVAGHLDQLTPREATVLELMARGLSNAAICKELHLSIKTVEPAIRAIFLKLGLMADAASNRRVLAVLAYLREDQPADG